MMNEKKYEILKDYPKTITCMINNNVTSATVYQIRALKDFSDIRQGELGGYIQYENNLSHDGNCWVYDEAVVFGQAKIYDNVTLKSHALIYGDGEIHGNISIGGSSKFEMNNTILQGDGKIR